ncbi:MULTISPECIES: hypothetical protein [unclassified Streptomyces]|uniref:hypothetical protein n=1 Tax=unclassified Streptomyces TaxID=2593676 RepID=UPI00336A537F
MSNTENTTKTIQDILGDTVTSTVTEFDAGGTAIEVRSGYRVAVIDGDTSGQWGLTYDPEEDSGFTGHQHIFNSLADALTAVQQAWQQSSS